MSMNYFIYSDIELEDKYDEEIRKLCEFPDGLSFFFEQVGGYDDFAEVSQVSRLLNIDLELFQKIDFPDNPDTHETWQSLEFIIAKLTEFKQAILQNPRYFEQVLHGGDLHPPDYGYLSQDRISKDIEELEKNLKRLQAKGSKKIRFFYM